MNCSAKRRAVALVTGLVLLAAAAGCGASEVVTAPAVSAVRPISQGVLGATADPRWEASINYEFGGDQYPNLAAMRDAADFVAVGRFGSTGEASVVQGDAIEDVVTEPIGTFQVEELLAGRLPEGALRVTLPFTPDKAAAIPPDRVLVFFHLRQDHTRSYRVIDKFGLWAATTRADLDAPIGEEAPADLDPFGGELKTRQLRALDDLIAYIRSLGSAGCRCSRTRATAKI